MRLLISYLSGVFFSVGLVISGMTNPNKVIGFLDIFGKWDASLAFVMGGAVIFNLFTFYIIKKRKKPVFTENFNYPKAREIDSKLIIGSSLFGVGWGISGVCPGPAIVNLTLLNPSAITFILSMLAGMILFKYANSIFSK